MRCNARFQVSFQRSKNEIVSPALTLLTGSDDVSQEIVYTSAPKGLKPGSRGFCTVVSTEGMAGNLADRLESHSGYRHAFGVNDERRDFNPVNWSHTTMRVAGTQFHVLSRVSDAGLDYSGRSNKLAHHVALDVSELPAAGPARTLQAPGVLHTEWSGEIGLVARRKLPPIPIPKSYQAATWRRVTGDPAWAGVIAERLLESNTPLSIIFPVKTDTMSLLTEVLDLIPLKQRWSISFSTYFTQLAPGTECRLRFVLDDTPEATALRKNPHAAVIDLIRKPTAPDGGELVECARSSQLPDHSLPASSTPPAHCPENTLTKPKSHRETPASAIEEVYDTEWDESDEQEAIGEYRVSQPEPSHETSLGKPHKPTRQSAYEMHGKQPRRLRNVGIICGVVVGLVLFASVSILLIQRLRGPESAVAPLDAVAGTMPLPPAPHKPQSDDGVAARKRAKNTAGDADSAHPELKSASAAGLPMDQLLADKGPQTKESTGQAKPGKNDPKTAKGDPVKNEDSPDVKRPNDASKPHPEKRLADPFDQLPKDELNPTFALLDLNAMPAGGWSVVINDPSLLTLELLGSDVFIREGIGRFHLKASESDGNRLWNLMLDVKNDEPAELGQFRLTTSSKKTKLTFHPADSVVPLPETKIIGFLALGLTAGPYKKLCRLGSIHPKPLLPIHFSDPKDSEPELPIDLDAVLTQELKEKDSKLSVALRLVGGITDYLVDAKDQVQEIQVNSSRKIFLSADSKTQLSEEWALFSDASKLVELEIKPRLSESSLKIQLAAFATISLFSTVPEYAEAANNARLGDLKVPAVRVPLEFEQLRLKLNKGIAKKLTDAIQITINELNVTKTRHMQKLTANAGDESAKVELAKAEAKLIIFQLQQKRHSPNSLTWLWTLLAGGAEAREKDNVDSIRGAIGSSKAELKISYDCKFVGESHTIVVYEASK